MVAALAPLLAPYGETEQNLGNGLAGISAANPLGTDSLGRDTLSRLIYGTRVALQAAFQPVLIAAVLGIPVGLWVGFRGGWRDRVTMRLVDAGDALPGILLAFAVIAVLGRGLTNAMIAVALIFVTTYVRLTRALVLVERGKAYVEAAAVSGLRTRTVLFGQILPNVAPALIVQTAIMMGIAVLVEATISFLGLGADVTAASWGAMLSEATRLQAVQPLLPWPPGVAITLTVVAFNLVGDGLRDALGMERPHRRRAASASRRGRYRGGVQLPEPPRGAGGLQVRGLTVVADRPDGAVVTLVHDVELGLRSGECVGVVGESGSGKTTLGLALLGLLPPDLRVAAGHVRLGDRELIGPRADGYAGMRGAEIAMVLQDPQTALSPVHTIGQQLVQVVRNHRRISRRAARNRARELLTMVGAPDAAARLGDYPHQFSGGMAQRVVIAMALAGEPRVLVADEPTTALDVTIQQDILDLLADLRQKLGMAVLLVTHDLGVVADSCDRVVVMYSGQIVEDATARLLFDSPGHPYTRALLAARPEATTSTRRLPTIPGRVPPPSAHIAACLFGPRCDVRLPECSARPIALVDGVRCVRQHPAAGLGADAGQRR